MIQPNIYFIELTVITELNYSKEGIVVHVKGWKYYFSRPFNFD